MLPAFPEGLGGSPGQWSWGTEASSLPIVLLLSLGAGAQNARECQNRGPNPPGEVLILPGTGAAAPPAWPVARGRDASAMPGPGSEMTCPDRGPPASWFPFKCQGRCGMEKTKHHSGPRSLLLRSPDLHSYNRHSFKNEFPMICTH